MAKSPFSAASLAKILGLLGSAHDGEVLSAARKADAMVREAGLTWQQAMGLQPAAAAAQLSADPPVVHNGITFWPPHNGSWAQSALFLVRQAARPGSLVDDDQALWLLPRLAGWRRSPPRGDEAARICAIWIGMTDPSRQPKGAA